MNYNDFNWNSKTVIGHFYFVEDKKENKYFTQLDADYTTLEQYHGTELEAVQEAYNLYLESDGDKDYEYIFKETIKELEIN